VCHLQGYEILSTHDTVASFYYSHQAIDQEIESLGDRYRLHGEVSILF